MRYIQELDLVEIDCDIDMDGTADNYTSLRIIPKKCPCGINVCNEILAYPLHGNSSICKYFVRMKDDIGEPGIYPGKILYCKASNSVKFIMEN